MKLNNNQPGATEYGCGITGASSALEPEIGRRQSELGLSGPGVWLEAAGFVDRTFLIAAAISDTPNPERIFGHREWLGHLKALQFMRTIEPGDPLDIDVIQELHRQYAEDSLPEIVGMLRKGPMWPVGSVDLSPRQIRAISANPWIDLEPHKKRAPFSLTRSLSRTHIPLAGPSNLSSSSHYEDRMRLVFNDYPYSLEKLCDWYNNCTSGNSGHHLAAELQQKIISIHPFFDMNGRTSRALLSLALKENNLPPAVLVNVDDDLSTTPAEWSTAVHLGTRRREILERRLEQNPDGITSLAHLLGRELESMLYKIVSRRGLIDPPSLEPGRYHSERAEYERFNNRITLLARRIRAVYPVGSLITMEEVEAWVEPRQQEVSAF